MGRSDNPGILAKQLVSRHLEQRQLLFSLRDQRDDETAAAYSRRLDDIEIAFDARLNPWREERKRLGNMLSAAKMKLQDAQKEISRVEKSLEVVTRCEANLKHEFEAGQENVLKEYERSRDATLVERQKIDLRSSSSLIQDLKHVLEEEPEQHPSKRQCPESRAEVLDKSVTEDAKDILDDFLRSLSPNENEKRRYTPSG
ncbi:hypothetical protein DL764_007427 [Monosporascus ibericus]|uniref:Uncharacterized protein n=1 Tax=Monosporascus ibericus TaxID=155417 RepID=A0A4Q4T0Q1_9PEZI|nr:hypothetical protein DL764_007427 [Monosporascus ibericus]